MAVSSEDQKLGLRPLRRTKLAEGVARQLMDQIESQALSPGTRLPSERQLMRELEVGRSTVREALNGLAMLGVVEIRHGDGAFVATPSLADPTDALVKAVAGCRTRDIFEARQVIEPRIAGLAAERRTDADRTELEAVLRAHEAAIVENRSALEQSADFHIRLADAAHSEAMADSAKSFIKVLTARTPMLEQMEGYVEWELEQHRGIYLAVRDSDRERAAHLMYEHVLGAASYQVQLGMPELPRIGTPPGTASESGEPPIDDKNGSGGELGAE